MRRDMDLVRAILLAVEDGDDNALRRKPLEIAGYDAAVVAGHAEIMQEAGLVDAHIVRPDGEPPPLARVFRLTWAGHDFLAATRNDTIWAKTKQVVREKAGDVPFEIFKLLAIKFVAAQVGITP
jgi:hypothetical protein